MFSNVRFWNVVREIKVILKYNYVLYSNRFLFMIDVQMVSDICMYVHKITKKCSTTE